MEKTYLVFIPVYNEEDTIGEIVGQIRQLPYHIDILVIDDGSSDGTRRMLDQLGAIHALFHDQNLGYGQTLIDGFHWACQQGYDHVITIDSDKQHQPGEISLFIEKAKEGTWDIISGSRYLKASGEDYLEAPTDRVKVNQRITQKINQLTGYQLTDTFCGFKMYRVEALQKLYLTEKGYGMPLQLWIQAWKNSLTVTEVPVELIYFDHRVSRALPYHTFRRYRYYLQIIEKEIKKYETTNISGTSR
jgi:dolichol-phosphate mannosyltransferase